jgi:hypothetical protein
MRSTIQYTYVRTKQWEWNPNFNTPEPDRPQHDRPVASINAQQYSSANVVLLRSHPRKQKFLFAFQKCYYIDSFHFFNYLSMKLRKLGSVCVEINPRIRRNTSVIIVIKLRTGKPWNRRSISGMIRGLSILHSVQIGSGGSSIMWLSPWEVKRPERKAEHSSPSSALTSLMSCN